MSGRLANALLAIASLLVFFGAAEALTRAVDLRPAQGGALANPPWLGDRWMLRSEYREEMAAAGLLARYYDLYRWDRYLFYRLRPDVDLELFDVFAPPGGRDRTRWSVHTNGRGFRSGEFAALPEPGRRRILALGDSSTFGWGVEHFEAYPARLGAALGALWGVEPDAVEVINLGVPGYSTFQGRVLLEREALALRPDAILWSYLSNDGAATGADDRATYEQRLGTTGAVLAVLHRSRAFETLEAWIGVARAAWQPPTPPDPYDVAQRNIPSYRAAAGNITAVVAAARRQGVPLVLVSQCVRGAPARVLAEVAAQTGTPHLDATALLDAAIPRVATEARFRAERASIQERYGADAVRAQPLLWTYLPDGCHPNPLGHRLVGQALAERVAPLLAPPGR